MERKSEMLTIRPMASGDRDAVMSMVTDFYHSPAVEHQVDPAILERAFWGNSINFGSAQK